MTKIRLDQIDPSPYQAREFTDDELAGSVDAAGLAVPVKVRPMNGRYEQVYGHRRVAAARAAGHTTIEALVEEMSDEKALLQSLIENLNRKDPDPVAIARQMKKLGLSNKALAKKLGRGQDSIADYLRLLNLSEVVRFRVIAGDIGVKHVREATRAEGVDPADPPDQQPLVTDEAKSKIVEDTLLEAADKEWSAERTRIAVEDKLSAKTPAKQRRGATVKQQDWENLPDVVRILDAIKVVDNQVPVFQGFTESVAEAKISPEGVLFVRRRAEKAIARLQKEIKRWDVS